MRLLTWNVWFGGHMFDERRAALLAELAARRPDVIALQEVTPELLGSLIDASWVRSGYRVFDSTDIARVGYGVVLLASVPVRRLSFLALPTGMGRSLSIAELASGLTVATVHLESMGDATPMRVAQLGLIQPHLIGLSNDVVLAGDMNFAPADADENAVLDPSFVDVWAALHPEDPGYTVDTRVNTMRFSVREKHTQKRIDRVFLRSSGWHARSIRLVGTEPIDPIGTFISDHFGLEVVLSP